MNVYLSLWDQQKHLLFPYFNLHMIQIAQICYIAQSWSISDVLSGRAPQGKKTLTNESAASPKDSRLQRVKPERDSNIRLDLLTCGLTRPVAMFNIVMICCTNN